VLQAGVEDLADNETRFVWLARKGADTGAQGPWKTSVVFWGAGDDAPGWLVRCLSEFAFRGVNLTLIESRPRKAGLGHYMFFADL
jgi:prephenate dehydratase